jgi:hypothetical protein
MSAAHKRWVDAPFCHVLHAEAELGVTWAMSDKVRRVTNEPIHMHAELAPDQKYIVFNREDFFRLVHHVSSEDMDAHGVDWESIAKYDAVVIRTRDTFAGPALYTYAASISLAAQLLEEKDAEVAKRLRNIADYFSERASEAEITAGAGDAHLPD